MAERRRVMISPFERADRIIEECCDDPEMWATHGRPGEIKLGILRRKIAEAITAAQVATTLAEREEKINSC